MTDKPKIAEHLTDYFASHPDGKADVIVVLNVPQPDLSHIISGKAAGPIATPDRNGLIDSAEQEIAKILDRTGAVELRKLRNAASVLAQVDQKALMALADSACVAEILGNARLR